MKKTALLLMFLSLIILVVGVKSFNKQRCLEGFDQKYSIKYEDDTKIIINRICAGEIDLIDTLVYRPSDQSYRSINDLNIIMMKKDTVMNCQTGGIRPKTLNFKIVIRRLRDSTYESTLMVVHANEEKPYHKIIYDGNYRIQEIWIFLPQKYRYR